MPVDPSELEGPFCGACGNLIVTRNQGGSVPILERESKLDRMIREAIDNAQTIRDPHGVLRVAIPIHLWAGIVAELSAPALAVTDPEEARHAE